MENLRLRHSGYRRQHVEKAEALSNIFDKILICIAVKSGAHHIKKADHKILPEGAVAEHLYVFSNAFPEAERRQFHSQELGSMFF